MKLTVNELQKYLTDLGFDTGGVDGIYGEKTASAIDNFLAQYWPGTVQVEEDETIDSSDNFWDGVKYFTREEFRCSCGKCGGFPAEPDEKLVRVLESMRENLGRPIIISSGVRCAAHNAEVGGVSNSRHLLGHAADFACSGVPQAQVLALIPMYPDIQYYYAIDNSYIHIDIGG